MPRCASLPLLSRVGVDGFHGRRAQCVGKLVFNRLEELPPPSFRYTWSVACPSMMPSHELLVPPQGIYVVVGQRIINRRKDLLDDDESILISNNSAR